MNTAKYLGIFILGFIAVAATCLLIIPMVWLAAALLPVLMVAGLPVGAVAYFLTHQSKPIVENANLTLLDEVQTPVWPIRSTGAPWVGRLTLPTSVSDFAQSELFHFDSVETSRRVSVGDATPARVQRVPFLFEGME